MAKQTKPKRASAARRRKLLNLIADFIEAVPKNKFNMDILGVHFSGMDGGGNDVYTAPTLHNCGTAGCALGWACSIPAVAAAGVGPAEVAEGDQWEAAAVALGMRYVEAEVLFGPARRGHRTPIEVAKNIRHFARTGRVPPVLRAALRAGEKEYKENRAEGEYADHARHPWLI